jgi:predicted RNA-binding protein with PUA-like domain
MRYWLFKSEPNVFGIHHLAKRLHQTEPWDGVRNYQARNFLRDDVQMGDLAFFYHSNCEPPGIVGVMSIVKTGYPDTTQFDPESRYYDPRATREKPIWYRVDVKLEQSFPRLISLAELKSHPALQSLWILRRGNRLSITPLTQSEWQAIYVLATDGL